MSGPSWTPGLGYSSDPADLVPGSVSGLRADADDLTCRAEDLALAAEDISRRGVPSWVGDSAAEWNATRLQLLEAVTVVSDLYRIVATALGAHADVLVWAREQARVAVVLWDRAEALDAVQIRGPVTPSSHGGWPPPTPVITGDGHGADLARLALQILDAARAEVRLSGVAAGQVLDQMSDGMPDGQFHLDEFLRGIGDWVAGLAGLVWRFNTIRFMIDPGGTVGDAAELGEGLWAVGAYLAEHPDQAVPVLGDTQTLQDNPGRWWGAMFPDLALGAVGGVGVLTRSARMLRGLADLADDVGDASRSERVLSSLAQSKIDMYQRLMDVPGTPEWLRRMFAGSQFDWMHQHRYTANQVWVDQLDNEGNLVGRFRLDSMNPGQELVSRKLTDLSQVTEATARSYIDEAIGKYGPNNSELVVADTPANRAQLGNLDDVIGESLDGQLILEVPVQPGGVPAAILEYADLRDVIIRDVAGTVYGA